AKQNPGFAALDKTGAARVYYPQGMLFRQSDLIQSGFLVTDRSGLIERSVRFYTEKRRARQACLFLFCMEKIQLK
ncbi:MAG: hypothetical protein ACLVB4_08055, partial [Butyricicoccus sp.]